MKSRIARDVFASSLALLSTSEVDSNVSESLTARGLHHDLPHRRIEESINDRGIFSTENRETVACFDQDAEAVAFQRVLEPSSVTSSSCRARAYKRFCNHATKHVQRAGAKPAGIDGDAPEPDVAHRPVDRCAPLWAQPLIEEVARDLDAGKIAVVAYPQIGVESQLSNRALRTLDLPQALDGHRRTIRYAR
jgi:hypothetical protein